MFTALLFSTVLITMGALVVDVGVQRVARSDMQALADVVSLDMSRLIDGSTKTTIEGRGTWNTALAQSVARNNTNVGDAPAVTAVMGTISSAGAFQETTVGTDIPSAVKVIAGTTVDFAFGVARSGGVSRSAITALSSFACYKVGSWAASVNTGNSVLINPMLQQMAQSIGVFSNGGAVRALDYKGLAAAAVDLNSLAVRLGVASVDELAKATVKLRDLYTAVEALAQPSNATMLNTLHTLTINASPTTTVQMGKLLGANSGAGALAGATANVLDLVGGSIALLNGTNAADVYLGSTLPSIANAGLNVKLVQGPHQYCGSPGSTSTVGVRSDTEQLKVRVGGNLNPTTVSFVPPTITGLLTSVASAQIIAENYATFDLSVAGTTSALKSITCGTPKGVTLDVTNGLATLTFSTPLRAEVHGKMPVAGLLGVSGVSLVDAVIRINAAVTVVATVGGSGKLDVSISVPPQAYDTAYPTTSGGVNVTSVTRSYGNVDANIELLNGSLGSSISLNQSQQSSLLDTILGSGLTQLLSPSDSHSLATTVINPMLGLIGAQVGGSDVILDSKPALNCATPKMVG